MGLSSGLETGQDEKLEIAAKAQESTEAATISQASIIYRKESMK